MPGLVRDSWHTGDFHAPIFGGSVSQLRITMLTWLSVKCLLRCQQDGISKLVICRHSTHLQSHNISIIICVNSLQFIELRWWERGIIRQQLHNSS